jgi:hypothetical protein
MDRNSLRSLDALVLSKTFFTATIFFKFLLRSKMFNDGSSQTDNIFSLVDPTERYQDQTSGKTGTD